MLKFPHVALRWVLLKPNSVQHAGTKEFKEINWLPKKEKLEH